MHGKTLDVFRCRLHGEVTLHDCRSCVDSAPREDMTNLLTESIPDRNGQTEAPQVEPVVFFDGREQDADQANKNIAETDWHPNAEDLPQEVKESTAVQTADAALGNHATVEAASLFDRVYLINLKRRPDRLANFRRMQETYG